MASIIIVVVSDTITISIDTIIDDTISIDTISIDETTTTIVVVVVAQWRSWGHSGG
jgi:hypothetical protein